MAAGYCYCLGINSNAFFLNDYKKAFILGLNVPKVTAYKDNKKPFILGLNVPKVTAYYRYLWKDGKVEMAGYLGVCMQGQLYITLVNKTVIR